MPVSRCPVWMRGITVVVAVALVLAANGKAFAGSAARSSGSARSGAVPSGRHPIKVGSVTIPPCASSRLAWCTRINVPYQYVGRDPATAGTIKLGFQWYPRRDGQRAYTGAGSQFWEPTCSGSPRRLPTVSERCCR
jgi:hypothetical protein